MQRKTDKRKVYNAGKCKTNEDFIHLHMSNHYRRILNAKKAVDNSPPYCYKLKRPSTSKPSGTTAKVNPPFENLPLTDRSLSTNSNKESCWGAESGAASSRYHANCVPDPPPHAVSNKHNVHNMDLVDRITYDTKNGPSAYCDESWTDVKEQRNGKRYKDSYEMQQQTTNETKGSPSAKRRLHSSGSNESAQKRKFEIEKKLRSAGVKGNKCFSPLEGKIYSKGYKSEAVSKLRSLRVYHPPRRKPKRVCIPAGVFQLVSPVPDAAWEKFTDLQSVCDSFQNKTDAPVNAQITLEVPTCKCTKICVCDSSETVLKKISLNRKEQSVTSSRDSAYNGGASSLPESRSPTPDQRRKKECCCCCCEKKQQRDGKPPETSKPMDNRVDSPRPPVPFNTPPPVPRAKNQQQESFKKMQEDALYVKFIQDITTEILDKNLYTNKALKKVMKKHIKNNLKRLHKDRMLKEVENLRIQLGIPEDKTLLELEAEGEGCDCSKFYPVISDSEFVLPKQSGAERSDSAATQTPEKMPRSISAVLASKDDENGLSGSDSDGEAVSVIQVTKSVREKRKEKNAEKTAAAIRGNSSDDSDRPSDPKKRSVLKNRKQKYVRSYSSTSSDSERSGRFSRKPCEPAECELSGSKEAFFGEYTQKSCFLNKKNRCVSFWKNPDLNRVFEVKHKKTVTRNKESRSQDVARDKHKND